MTSQDPPACAKCRHYRDHGEGIDFPVCVRLIFNVVSGEKKPLMLPCQDERRWNVQPPEFCGRDGAFFEPRQGDPVAVALGHGRDAIKSNV